MRKLLLVAFCLCTTAGCSGTIEYDLRREDVLALVDGEKISAGTVARFEERLKKAGRFHGRAPLLAVLIKNRLLANEYRRTHAAGAPGLRSAGVDQEFMFMTRDLALVRLASGNLETSIRRSDIPSSHRLRSFFRPGTRIAALIAVDGMPLGNPVLYEYQFPGGKAKTLRLKTVYGAQNPHGKAEIRKGNHRFLRRRARALLEKRFVLRLSRDPRYRMLGEIRRVIEDRRLVNLYLQSLGFKEDMHDSAPEMRKRADRIGAGRIQKYYQANRSKFREVRSVSCRHIRLKNEKSARKVYGMLKQGADFGTLARRWSLAADARDKEPGRLPEIHNTEGEQPFLHKLCLIQGRGKVSFPLRVPGHGYEIVLVDERRERIRSLKDDSTRREIARTLAGRDARREFETTRRRLLRQARIRIHVSVDREKLNLGAKQ